MKNLWDEKKGQKLNEGKRMGKLGLKGEKETQRNGEIEGKIGSSEKKID